MSSLVRARPAAASAAARACAGSSASSSSASCCASSLSSSVHVVGPAHSSSTPARALNTAGPAGAYSIFSSSSMASSAGATSRGALHSRLGSATSTRTRSSSSSTGSPLSVLESAAARSGGDRRRVLSTAAPASSAAVDADTDKDDDENDDHGNGNESGNEDNEPVVQASATVIKQQRLSKVSTSTSTSTCMAAGVDGNSAERDAFGERYACKWKFIDLEVVLSSSAVNLSVRTGMCVITYFSHFSQEVSCDHHHIIPIANSTIISRPPFS